MQTHWFPIYTDASYTLISLVVLEKKIFEYYMYIQGSTQAETKFPDISLTEFQITLTKTSWRAVSKGS